MMQISERALLHFANQFREKLFSQQLAYHELINYEEEVNYLPPFQSQN